MKQFLKMVLAVIIGLLIMGFLSIFLFAGIAGSVATMTSSSGTPVPAEGVLLMDLSKMTVAEQPRELDLMATVQGEGITTLGLWQSVTALNKAALDPGIKYLYVKTDGMAVGISQLQELRKALQNFRAQGKAVISFMEYPTTGSVYLASVSDKVYMSSYEGASNAFLGISSRLIFLKDLLDKLGVNVQLIRHGKYKSAGEMYIRSSASQENMEQNEAMISSLWKSLAGEIAESRGISVESLDRAIDNMTLNYPEDFVQAQLADSIYTRTQLKQRLTALAVEDKFEDINFIPFPDYVAANAPKPNFKNKNRIAVIYADGEIIEGEGKPGSVAGSQFARIIEAVRADSLVKAVVLRVNSPGGSVFASEKMKVELDMLKEVKPLIASYGSLAASGGYWISNNCDKIFSDATTLTGSIGVFSMIPDFSATAKDIAHVNITAVNSHKHSDVYTLMRPLDQLETERFQESVERIYDRFVTTVSEGRGLEKDFVDSVAQGRVWTGSEALRLGLVDELGTLEDAIHYAAISAGCTDFDSWAIDEYPKPLTTFEMLMSMFSKESGAADDVVNAFSGTPFEGAADAMLRWQKTWQSPYADFTFARLPFEVDIR